MSDYIKYEVRVYSNGDKYWFLNGKYHREDGPALEYADGTKHWYINGKSHRIDGPAIENFNGSKFWYLNGKEYSEAEFNKKMKSPYEGKIVDLKNSLEFFYNSRR